MVNINSGKCLASRIGTANGTPLQQWALQLGIVLLARERLAARLRHPSAWAVVALVNLSAMTIFLWHQSALVGVALATLSVAALPGLHDQPDSLGWVLARLAWLPAFAAALALLGLGFRRHERG